LKEQCVLKETIEKAGTKTPGVSWIDFGWDVINLRAFREIIMEQ
jgi:hypothetical protein